MVELHAPWLQLSVGIPLAGALVVWRARDWEVARRRALGVAVITMACTVAAWIGLRAQNALEVCDPCDCCAALAGTAGLVLDPLSAPLLPATALVFLLAIFATLRTKAGEFRFARTLVSLSLALAMFSCRQPWGIIALLAVQCVPLILELHERGESARVFVIHMGLFIALLVGGWFWATRAGDAARPSLGALGMLIVAVLLRCGIVPLHCWMADLFDKATFGTALLFTTPLAGVYAAARLVIPIAPNWAVHGIGLIALLTAVYAAGIALVQVEGRRFCCYVLLSHASLVLAGLETGAPIGLTGALSLWISVQLSLTGFGLTLRSLEARTGRLALADYHGYYEHMPLLAAFFLLTGLASVGFPGTVGFVATELLLQAAVAAYPYVGIAVVIAAALNGIAVLQAYFRLFTGSRHSASISLRVRPREQIAVLVLTALIVGGGLVPQPGVAWRSEAADYLLSQRVVASLRPADARN